MEEETNKTNDKPWLFKKGNPGGPGRPAGKSLKEYSREYLAKMTDEERMEFLEGLPKETIWKMAEGNPKQDVDSEVKATLNIVVPLAVAKSFNINATDTETGGSDTQ